MSELDLNTEVAAVETTAVATPRVRRTRKEMIAVLEAKLAKLRAEPEAKEPKAKKVKEEYVPAVGDKVDFYFGRGDNRAVQSGVVLGIREPGEGEKGGRIVKVMVGEGYDADIKGVFLSALIVPPAVEVPVAAIDEDVAED